MDTTTNETKPRKRFRDLDFDVAQATYCCGYAEVGGFREAEGQYDFTTRKMIRPRAKHYTRQEQAEAAAEALERQVKSGRHGDSYAHAVTSFVTKGTHGAKATYPELLEALLKRGWTKYAEFKNVNTGNEVTLLQKGFPEVHEDKDEDE